MGETVTPSTSAFENGTNLTDNLFRVGRMERRENGTGGMQSMPSERHRHCEAMVISTCICKIQDGTCSWDLSLERTLSV